MGSREKQTTAHVLVIAYTQQGHMNPMLRFSRELFRKGITVSFVTYEDTIAQLTSKLDFSLELQSPNFHFIGLHNPLERDTNIPFRDSITLEEAFKPLLEKLLHEKSSGVAGPTSILSDMFFSWAQDVAEKLQIPRYIFVPAGAVLARFMQGFVQLFVQAQFQVSETDGKLVKFQGSVCIPGLPPLHYQELPLSPLINPAEFLVRCQKLWRAAGVVVNSCYELEEEVIDSWRRPGHPGYEQTKVPKIYPVGPFFSTSVTLPSFTVLHGLEDSANESLLWLGSQPPSSVLYVAFGTLVRLSPGKITELALGLEGSKQRFLWVLPQPKASREEETPSITDILPPGFEARVRDRGCIITGWAPQLQILAHAATGGFLTHSGWNSSLESMMMGVPMIAWPQSAEQHLNCRYLVDGLKIADQIQTGPENTVERSEVERAVRLLMVESEGQAMRRRAEELQRKAAGAVATGGSRSQVVEEFVHDISS